jgi:hypothetical protein
MNHFAFFVEDGDALVFLRKISELVKLVPNVVFEINQYLGKETFCSVD